MSFIFFHYNFNAGINSQAKVQLRYIPGPVFPCTAGTGVRDYIAFLAGYTVLAVTGLQSQLRMYCATTVLCV